MGNVSFCTEKKCLRLVYVKFTRSMSKNKYVFALHLTKRAQNTF